MPWGVCDPASYECVECLEDLDCLDGVYCNGGGRSNKAYGKLIKLGYKKKLQALFTDWKQAGQKVEN